jgi:hypothetical protein
MKSEKQNIGNQQGNGVLPCVSSILSDKYRLMIYFAHSTMVMYSKTIETHEKMSVGEFMDKNTEIMKRVFDEGLSIMNYELSSNQMQKAALVYLQSKHFPSSVFETEVYQLS